MRTYPTPLTGPEALARMTELSDAIARCHRMNIVGLIPELEEERVSLRKQFMTCAYSSVEAETTLTEKS